MESTTCHLFQPRGRDCHFHSVPFRPTHSIKSLWKESQILVKATWIPDHRSLVDLHDGPLSCTGSKFSTSMFWSSDFPPAAYKRHFGVLGWRATLHQLSLAAVQAAFGLGSAALQKAPRYKVTRFIQLPHSHFRKSHVVQFRHNCTCRKEIIMRFLITQLTIALFASGSAYCNSEGFVKRDGAVENVVQFTEDIATFASPLITSPLIYEKYARTSATYRPNQYPHLTTSTGAWQWVQADWWTAGFYPGTLYLLGERARKWPACAGGAAADWVERGRKWSEALIPLQTRNTVGHDTGFLSFPFVHELQVNPNNQTAKTSIQNFARLLADRYSSVVGATSSWDSNSPDFLVIIDNMMNLEVLFQAADLGSDQFYRTIARNHADKTAGNHLRADGSSFHVVNYNRNTGNVINKWTAQGYRDWSTWARGQAWGAYGYVMMFERTRTQSYLQTARRMAQLFVNRLYSSPATRFGIPPWDFDAPTPASADTSAAALAVTAFLGLSKAEAFVGNSTGASYWSSRAVQLLSDTSEHYFARSASWDAILSNGTSNHPSNVKDTGLVYGDYYYVMAGNIMLDMGLIQC